MNDWQAISLTDVGTDFQYFTIGLAAVILFIAFRK